MNEPLERSLQAIVLSKLKALRAEDPPSPTANATAPTTA
jgi:hypothetical protein